MYLHLTCSFADASTIATFVNNWAAMACGSHNIIDEVIFDCSTLFPLQDLPSFSSSNFLKEDVLSEILMKRFLFDGSKKVSPGEEVGDGPSLDCPTRFDAVSALIWGLSRL